MKADGEEEESGYDEWPGEKNPKSGGPIYCNFGWVQRERRKYPAVLKSLKPLIARENISMKFQEGTISQFAGGSILGQN
jgi:hypothetical protein